MDTTIPTQIAETIQTAHINHSPSVAHDANPSTAADKKQPLYPLEDELDDLDDSTSEENEDDLYDSHLKRYRRLRRLRTQLPPMPDLRFEQSYLASIRNADAWWKIALITVRDQVCTGSGV